MATFFSLGALALPVRLHPLLSVSDPITLKKWTALVAH